MFLRLAAYRNSHAFGFVNKDCGIPALARVPISGILGDQQAALFGQCAFHAGKAKCTYGTGLFLMKNTGTKRIPSTHGLLTTIAYQIGVEGKIHYALEGSVSHSGSTIQWLRDKLNLVRNASESESLAMETDGNEGLYLVPAFAGLFAKHWRSDARACIVGMTASHHKGHICRAALEAACYQAREVFEAILEDSPFELHSLSVDGGATENRFMMQFQSDILNKTVTRPEVGETTALGAAFAAGLTVGMWRDLDELEGLRHIREKYQPKMDEYQREKNWHGWQKAVSRSMGWIETDEAIIEKIVKKSSLDKVVPLIALSGLAVGFGYFLGQSRRK
jgi:glycerol kinase